MPSDVVHWYSRPHASHQIETAKATAANYRTICLSVTGTLENPLYTAVMIKRPLAHIEIQEDRMTASQFSEKIDTLWNTKKYGAYLVSATGTIKNPLFAACFRPMDDKPIVRYGILGTGGQMAGLHYNFWHDGYIPVCFDAYGTVEDSQLVAIWHKNTARVAWNVDAASHLYSPADMQAMFNAATVQGARPTAIAAAAGNRYFELFIDNKVGGWISRIDLSQDAYALEMKERIDAGLIPISVSVQTNFLFPRYSVIFATGEKPMSRLPKVSVSHSAPKVEGIDNAMLRFIKDHSIRGASLAITKGSRLVYAAGYTHAEPDYPEHKETTLFRQASVSKTFVAAAIYRLIQLGTKLPDGTLFDLDTRMQDVLKLKTPEGAPPLDPRFADISIQDLMESCSSVSQWLIWHDEPAAAAFKASLPCQHGQLASYIAAQPLGKKDPGSHSNVDYGNTDYFLLSQVIAKLTNSANFEEGLRKLVLDPLKMTRVRGSRSLKNAQAADEALHHNVNIKPALKPGKYNEYEDMAISLAVRSSKFADTRPLVPEQYGGIQYELSDGCGGLSAAVTDIARLVAAFSLTDEKAVFSKTTLQNWCGNTFIATKIKSNPDPLAQVHGYHGFDWGSLANPAKPSEYYTNFSAAKGGWLPSHSTSLQFTSGGFGYIVSFNSTPQSDIKSDWLTDHEGLGLGVAPNSILAISQAHDWKNVDLFPSYGMPSFIKRLQIDFPTGPIDFSNALSPHLKFKDVQKVEQAAMTASMNRMNKRPPGL